MTRSSDKHLDDAEIESLVSASTPSLAGSPRSSVSPYDAMKSHLETCEECQQRVRMYEEAKSLLRRLRSEDRGAAGSSCPADADWILVAGGTLASSESISLLQHAARCVRCGPLLKAATEDLSDNTTQEEEEMLAALASSNQPGQGAIAELLRNSSPAAAPLTRPARSFTIWHPLNLAIAAALLIAVGGVAVYRYWHSSTPATLISQAYAENRTLELRVPGAAYAPTKTQRGSGTSALDRPGSLLRAESVIADRLQKTPNDPVLLEAEARADLLDGNYEHAIETAKRALETQPDSVDILLDLSTAYFLRAEQNGNDEHDYALAIEQQGRALAKSPDNPVVLYNRAVCEQRAFFYDRAAEDWKRFLQVELNPEWRADGKRQYDALILQMQGAGQANLILPGDLSQVSHSLRAHASQRDSADWPAARDEVYVNLALLDWLPNAVSVNPQHESVMFQSQDALAALAEVLDRRHGDRWLSDLLAGSHSKNWRVAAKELSTAVRLNDQGDPVQVIDHARRSLDAFHRDGNDAGSAAAAFQLARALAHSQAGNQCLPPGLDGMRATTGHRYPWLATRVYYELSTCWSLQGNSERADHFARLGEESARSAGYPVLGLVGQMFLDGVSARVVAQSESWNRMRAGLQQFWSAPYPDFCAAEFFVDLGFAAGTEHLWRVAEAAGQEAVLMYAQDNNRVVKAASHAGLARAALAAGDARLADAEFGNAAGMFASWGESNTPARTTLEIERASLELRQGLLDRARVRLEAVRNLIPDLNDHSTATLYHETVGELYFRSGDPIAAERELLEAIRLIEMDKNSLSSETEYLAWQLDKSQTYRLLLEIFSTRPGSDARSLAFLEWYQAEPLRVDADDARKLMLTPLGDPAVPAQGEKEASKQLAALRSDAPVLVWASFPSELVIWKLDQAGVHRVRVNVAAQLLGATAARFARLCADPTSDLRSLQQDGRQLYTWLVQPVADELPGSGRLIIESDPILRTIPLPALQAADGRYLGDRFSISESPGILYSRILRPERPVTPRTTVLAIGDPLPGAAVAGRRLQRLPDANREAHDIASRFDEHLLLQGKEATLSRVVKLLPQTQIFHFAGHALTRGGEPGLLLASGPGDLGGSSLLGRHDFVTHDLQHMQLAVLSGCETALADEGMVDPASLVRIFLRSGVPHVIASKWRVDSTVSSQTMAHLYTDLLGGRPAVAALADSERAIRSNPATAHPYFWAAFAAFGA